ncbi:MAG: hypothetical protein ISR89_10055 [Candidatus Marinimicrobia bacterium]|nr:hypothetical protein [Candidatus Neomarinimicrobiota bacterium]MBL7031498.1 hypothetical protein [Candidatus Neomarinimicrobiota bacterium]
MKFKIFLIFVLGFSIENSFAQDKMRERPDPIDWTKKLDLTEDQFKQFMSVQESYREQIIALRENASGDRRGMMDAFQTLGDKRDKQVKSILNKKQYKKFTKELKAQQKERRKQMNGRQKGQGRRGSRQGRNN